MSKLIYLFSEIASYELGTIIKNNPHQTKIINAEIEEIIMLLNIIQLKIKIKIPKVIIDQG